jgi:hypothetical protein
MNKIIDLLKNHLPKYLKTHIIDPYKKHVLETIIKCYDHQLGFVVNACPNPDCTCDKTYPVPKTCKLRYCFNCGPTQHYRWLLRLSKILLRCTYTMITFTLPLFVRPFFKTSFKVMVNIQFQAASYAIKKFSKAHNFEPGMIMVLQLIGGYMLPHPHIHVIVTLGGLLLNLLGWKKFKDFHAVTISRYYTERFIQLLKVKYRQGRIQLPSEYRYLNTIKSFNDFIDAEVKRIRDQRFENLSKRSRNSAFIRDCIPLTETKAKSWCVYVSRKPKQNDNSGPPVGYISRYVSIPPITNNRLLGFTKEAVRFVVKDKLFDLPTEQKMNLDQFFDSFIFAIPPKYFPIIRRSGLFANGSRNKLNLAKQSIEKDWQNEYRFAEDPKDIVNQAFCSHRTRQIELTGKDPYLCACGQVMQPMFDLGQNHPFWLKHSVDDLKNLSYSELKKIIKTLKFNNTS